MVGIGPPGEDCTEATSEPRKTQGGRTMIRYQIVGLMSVLLASAILIPDTGAQPILLWDFNTSGGVYSAIPVNDVDGDLVPDVVAAIYYSDPEPNLYCVSGTDGALIWASSDCQGTWGNQALAAIEDVTGDEIDDVILGTPGGIAPGSSVFLKDGADGTTVWTWCTYTQGPNWGWLHEVAPYPDVDGDELPEVAAAAGGNSSDRSGTVFLFDGESGDTIWTWRVPLDGAWSLAVIADINGDDADDIIVGAGGNSLDNRVWALDGPSGSSIWQRDLEASVSDVAIIEDINGDEIEDVVAGGWADYVACLDGTNGLVLWTRDIGTIIMELSIIRDVTGNGIDDVIVGSWSSSVYCLEGESGEIIWSVWVGSDNWSVDALSDVNGDGVDDVAVGSLNGYRAVCLSGVDGAEIWSYPTTERVYDVSSAPDLNGDHLPDILVGLQDHGYAPTHLLAFDGDALPTPEITLLLAPDQRQLLPGETLSYRATVYNNTQTQLSAWYVAEVELPNGNPYGPVVGPVNFVLEPGQMKSRTLSHTVPPTPPLGDYAYKAKVGNPPNTVIDERSFPFSVVLEGE
ncbi:hypothetical protein AMJ82_07830 [candidate division TA06 bacterium SM23_40]|uniref:Pyrrolo-quinoline quinone repeat domain-containing protein n=1 Tax=candidate division TA06 bacterium SM23_40 TaxID=1703774 RepID=A0A0S8G6V4_UNCT6|nr:MAG: hypothetical protein AMJ82_07830 [candidate division TA06 bacterium SM23_40]